MPKYLTISDDLQLVPGEERHFLSKSGKTLDEVEYQVLGWLEDNPNHPNQPMVNAWLDCAGERRGEENRTIVLDAALKEFEKSTRKCLIMKYRRQGLSMSHARQKANENVRAVTTRFMED
jgi:hypothetical protein